MERFISRVYSSVVEHVAANQEIPEIPQGMHFPPHNYWKQLRIEIPKITRNQATKARKRHKRAQRTSLVPQEGNAIITKVDSFLVLTFSVFHFLYVKCLSMFVSSLHDH